jgi:hypothetical protein
MDSSALASYHVIYTFDNFSIARADVIIVADIYYFYVGE